jgi:hypothetical protein
MSRQIATYVGERTVLNNMLLVAHQLVLEEDDAASIQAINTLDNIVLPHIVKYSNYIHAPMVDDTIPFGILDKIIADFNEYTSSGFVSQTYRKLQMNYGMACNGI